MKAVARLLNDMLAAGIVHDYAVFGAVAQMRYTDAVATMDADILVGLPAGPGLIQLGPIYDFCRGRGYLPEGEAIRVGNWPVQFIPAFDDLTREAMQNAETGEVDDEPIRVVRAIDLALIALSVGRAKDHARILALLECGAVTRTELAAAAESHGMSAKWLNFQTRFPDGSGT